MLPAVVRAVLAAVVRAVLWAGLRGVLLTVLWSGVLLTVLWNGMRAVLLTGVCAVLRAGPVVPFLRSGDRTRDRRGRRRSLG
ncbi:hypothetical protein Acsp02_57240 [Actinoplanes sp. NBRC 103695]|nr:hypothetical protein Acsp02_57240 [Actinoplanes sp. NBRC 103695]